ncbi:MAG TPA: hypothetical protein PLL14_08925 [Accumulibacter sp.]|nr:hypothetical protein [Accumulibacter sp.]
MLHPADIAALPNLDAGDDRHDDPITVKFAMMLLVFRGAQARKSPHTAGSWACSLRDFQRSP